MTNKDWKIRCRVCNKPYDGTQHCGVEVCRACAAFYKRTIISKKKYRCRKGTDNCRLDTGRKECCQQCRMTRCLLVGLTLNDSLSSAKSENDDPDTEPSTSEAERSQQATPFVLNNMITEDVKDVKDVKAVAMIHPTEPSTSVLTTLDALYQRMCSERKRFEESLKLTLQPRCPIEVNGRYLSLLSLREITLIFRFQEPFIREMVELTFPAFKQFPDDVKEDILNLYITRLWDLEGAYRTYKVFNDLKSTRMLWTDTMYVEFGKMNEYLGIESPTIAMACKEITDWIEKFLRLYLNTTHHSLHRVQITDFEYAAVVALMLWDDRLFLAYDESVAEVAKQQRNIIYDELYHYYKHVMHLENYVDRVVNLKEVIMDLQMNTLRLRNDANYVKLFEYFVEDKYLYERIAKLPP